MELRSGKVANMEGTNNTCDTQTENTATTSQIGDNIQEHSGDTSHTPQSDTNMMQQLMSMMTGMSSKMIEQKLEQNNTKIEQKLDENNTKMEQNNKTRREQKLEENNNKMEQNNTKMEQKLEETKKK